MKKIVLLSFVTCMITLTSWGQLVTVSQLESLKTQLFGNTKDYKKIALDIKSSISLDNDGALTYSKVVEVPGRTQSELFETAKKWVVNNFKGNDSDIQLVDKETGCIIVRGYVENVVKRNEYALADDMSLKPILKMDFKDGRVRITCTQYSYAVEITRYGAGFPVPVASHQYVSWEIKNCYPLVKRTTAYITQNKVTSKALVMAHLCATFYINTVEDLLLKRNEQKAEQEEW